MAPASEQHRSRADRNPNAPGRRGGAQSAHALTGTARGRNTGSILASINAGGGDEMQYDPASNRYYVAASRWTASGKATATGGSCSATSLCDPMLAIIDASTRKLVAQVPSGNNAHSVAVDPATGKVFMPVSSGSSPAGCSTCGTADPAQLLTFVTR